MCRNNKYNETKPNQTKPNTLSLYWVGSSFLALSVTLLFSIALISSCKKENESSSGLKVLSLKSGGNLPHFTTYNEVNEHLKWLARGLAHWNASSNFVTFVDSLAYLSTNDSNEVTFEYVNSLYPFKSALSGYVNVTFPINSYDDDGFASILFNMYPYGTKIVIPSSILSGLPFVVTASTVESDSLTDFEHIAYFINSTTGQLDSLIIDEDNEDDFYVWVVDLFEPLLIQSDYGSEGALSSIDLDLCNGSTTCEPGDKYNPDCPNCPPAADYMIKITVVKVRKDVAPYREKFLGGQYDFAISAGLLDGSQTNGSIHHWGENKLIHRVKRSQVCKENKRGNEKGSNCPEKDHYIDFTIYPRVRVNPAVENKMCIILYERDRSFTGFSGIHFSNYTVYNYLTTHCPNSFNRYVPGGSFCYPDLWMRSHQIYYAAEIIDLTALVFQSPQGGSVWTNGMDDADIKIELIKL